MSEKYKIPIILTGISTFVLVLALFLPMIGSSGAYCFDCEKYDMNIHDIADKNEIGQYGPYEDAAPRMWVLIALIASIISLVFLVSPNFEQYRSNAPILSLVAGICALLGFFAVLSVFNDVNEGGRDNGAPFDVAEMMWASWALIGCGVFNIISGIIGFNLKNN